MRKISTLAVVFALVTSSCLFGGGGDARTVLVDFSHDEFASSFIANFPNRVTVTPGTKLVFKQTWTGEPHTITAGTIADAAGEVVVPLLEDYAHLPEEEVPEEVFQQFEEATADLPWAFGEEDELNQTVAQPCYLDEGEPPTGGEPCDVQEQPAEFTGEESYYNSGIIPYEGPQGNTFEVQLADEMEPGSYMFYCAVHGPFQRTMVDVVEHGTEVPSADEVNRQAREEIRESADPLLRFFREARDESEVTVEGVTVESPFAGLWTPEQTEAVINEFVPRTITVEAGEPITWRLMGADHSISFNVPEYFPQVEFLDDGTVRLNPKLDPAAGGAPQYEEPEEEGPEGPPGEEPAAEEDEGRPEPPSIDAGTWDGGSEFWSSGLLGGEPYFEYTLQISEPGSYRYACLLHPPMVGTIEVIA